MCSCGHARDDHHPNGHCLRCTLCDTPKGRMSLTYEGWWRTWNTDRRAPPPLEPA